MIMLSSNQKLISSSAAVKKCIVFIMRIVISKKIYHGKPSLLTKSFIASFGIHAVLFAAITILIDTYPVFPYNSNTKIALSLVSFTENASDLHPIKMVSSQKTNLQNTLDQHAITTSQKTSSLTPSMSSEASAPLVHSQMSASTSTSPSSSNKNDSPHLTFSPPEHELPKNSVADSKIDGAAFGLIRTMIENAIIYPPIARKMRIEGIALVAFTLKPDGTVETAHVKNSSGNSVLDAKAIQTILNLSGQYPALGKTFELSVPIAFTLSNT